MVKDFTIRGALIGKVARVIIFVAIGIVIGIAGTLFAMNYNPPDKDDTDQLSVVLERVQSRGELVSVSQNYSIVDKASNQAKLFDFIDIPFTEKSFWYRYNGTIKAGINLENLEYERLNNGVKLIVESPYIISNTPDMKTSGVLEERNNVLNPIKVSDVDKFQTECRNRSEEETVKAGLLEEARTEAETRLAELLQTAIGDSFTVSFEWREPEEG